jgi:hypothetical protein
MNPPEEITPQYAERLVALLGMMGDLGRDRLAFLVGHMAAKDVDLAIEAFGALMGTELPLEDSLAGCRPWLRVWRRRVPLFAANWLPVCRRS